ncbi:PEPxxWA-CTERM sorting domain-containing protein [Sphingomonas aliaeris]|uniref:PEPxxWA-CTERM sorting domain-containing protein n=1 Tax=Sphingomonas aliaeris TaxID=2759526 RepID=A0A974NTR3_9SPHN|nr:PEPxxWA-CTERM sorting domain-containing protein [Sphingomonas aliaeris]QQV76731.1 PEPxxWA-CTERM sorting domain-containing protein [Sphingomonas aliaeris]
MGGTYAFSSSPMGGNAIAAALADPLSVFAARSPGGRAPGALTQTKPSRAKGTERPVKLAEVFPSERVLSNVRTRQPDAFAPTGLPDAVFVGPAGDAVPGIDTITPVVPTGDGGVPIFTPGGIGPVVPGGGGGTGEPPPVTPPPVTPPVPPVPEPTTWLMMIAGFFAIGHALRSRRRGAVGTAAMQAAAASRA